MSDFETVPVGTLVELERIKAERDEAQEHALEAQKIAHAAMDERDALSDLLKAAGEDAAEIKQENQELAAHVEEWRRGLMLVEGWANSDAEGNQGDARDWLRLLRNWINENGSDDAPTTSLARRKAEWQAEALELEATEAGHNAACRLLLKAKRLRRQAEEGAQ